MFHVEQNLEVIQNFTRTLSPDTVSADIFGDNILGAELIKRSMALSVAYGRITHAYIICGEAGFGKKMLAHAFDTAILCYETLGGRVCGVCTS
jgi:DNA polymerase III gamma/tau subunit